MVRCAHLVTDLPVSARARARKSSDPRARRTCAAEYLRPTFSCVKKIDEF
jgi:hypothetical protein